MPPDVLQHEHATRAVDGPRKDSKKFGASEGRSGRYETLDGVFYTFVGGNPDHALLRARRAARALLVKARKGYDETNTGMIMSKTTSFLSSLTLFHHSSTLYRTRLIGVERAAAAIS